MLACEALSVERGKLPVVLGVSASLVPGQITAICGPNGAGKSTLLAALAGLHDPASGRVTLDGRELAAMHPRDRARAIGYLPQGGEAAWDVSVASLVALGRLPHRDAGEAAVAGALAACDLARLAHRPISTLSGGERARALLARVLAGEPRWILADEPLAALDLAHQLGLLRTLREVADCGAGVVIVLHDLALAMNHADRVLVLDQGALAADSSPERALHEGVIAEVWGVSARWLGEPGARALLAAPSARL
jgi:iron complex transport system ATP-binding protein